MRATDEILSALRQAAGEEVSSRALCERLGVSRAAVWKQIETLRGLGYRIGASPRRGYRLEGAPDLPHGPEVAPLLTTRRIGGDCRYIAETGSTNRDAAALAQAGAEEGVVVTAGAQHAGRGRMARAWFSPAGVNLYFSLVLRPAVEPLRAASLPLVAGLAVAEAVSDLAPELRPAVKWPNDILVDGRKLCGILCEMQAETDRVRYIILGAGVNVNLERAGLPEEIRARAASLRIVCGRTFSRAAVLAAILNRFEPLYDQWLREGLTPLIARLDACDALRGRMITLEQGGGQAVRGRADGIQADGALRLVTDRGPVTLYSGETHIGT